MSEITQTYTSGWDQYELIDAGGGKKLERWGDIITIRPEVQAYFKSGLPFDEWNKIAHWEFIQGKGQTGKWKKLKAEAKDSWTIEWDSLKFKLELTKFKHVGLFPEQKINWEFIKKGLKSDSRFINFFAYTGAMSCVARENGAETYHVDSVKQLITWAAENANLSNLNDIKWVHEDALKFVSRLVKRNEKFDAIVMDPPAWGIGAKNEKWKLEDKLDELLKGAKLLLNPKGKLIVNTYSPKIEAKQLYTVAYKVFPNRKFEVTELWMKTNTGKKLYYGNLLRVG